MKIQRFEIEFTNLGYEVNNAILVQIMNRLKAMKKPMCVSNLDIGANDLIKNN